MSIAPVPWYATGRSNDVPLCADVRDADPTAEEADRGHGALIGTITVADVPVFEHRVEWNTRAAPRAVVEAHVQRETAAAFATRLAAVLADPAT